MTLKIKLQIAICIVLLALPTCYLLFKIWNLSIDDDGTFLFKYMIFTLISWFVLSPVLLNLLNIAAKQIANAEFNNWRNERN